MSNSGYRPQSQKHTFLPPPIIYNPSQSTRTQSPNFGIILPLQPGTMAMGRKYILVPSSLLRPQNSSTQPHHLATNGFSASAVSSLPTGSTTQVFRSPVNSDTSKSKNMSRPHQGSPTEQGILRLMLQKPQPVVSDRPLLKSPNQVPIMREERVVIGTFHDLPENQVPVGEKGQITQCPPSPDLYTLLSTVRTPMEHCEPQNGSVTKFESVVTVSTHVNACHEFDKISCSRQLVFVEERVSIGCIVEELPSIPEELKVFPVVQPSTCLHDPSELTVEHPSVVFGSQPFEPVPSPIVSREIGPDEIEQVDPVLNISFPVMHIYNLKLSNIIPRQNARQDLQTDVPDLPRPSIRLLARIGKSLVADHYRKKVPSRSTLRGVKRLPMTDEVRAEERDYLQQTLPSANVAMATVRWRPMALGAAHETTCVQAGCPYQPDSYLSLSRHLEQGHYSLQQLTGRFRLNSRSLSAFYPVNPANTKPPGSNGGNCYMCKECTYFFTSAKAIQSHASRIHKITNLNASESSVMAPCGACREPIDKISSRLPVCQIKVRGAGKPSVFWNAIRQLLHGDPARTISGHALAALLLFPSPDSPLCFPKAIANTVLSMSRVGCDSLSQRCASAISAVHGVLIFTGKKRYRRVFEETVNLEELVGPSKLMIRTSQPMAAPVADSVGGKQPQSSAKTSHFRLKPNSLSSPQCSSAVSNSISSILASSQNHQQLLADTQVDIARNKKSATEQRRRQRPKTPGRTQAPAKRRRLMGDSKTSNASTVLLPAPPLVAIRQAPQSLSGALHTGLLTPTTCATFSPSHQLIVNSGLAPIPATHFYGVNWVSHAGPAPQASTAPSLQPAPSVAPSFAHTPLLQGAQCSLPSFPQPRSNAVRPANQVAPIVSTSVGGSRLQAIIGAMRPQLLGTEKIILPNNSSQLRLPSKIVHLPSVGVRIAPKPPLVPPPATSSAVAVAAAAPPAPHATSGLASTAVLESNAIMCPMCSYSSSNRNEVMQHVIASH
uniref:C2H2-type domain-containing protein n=2 Tax=Mesocestoides corti TaxID=53468 RepID=A0A5K3EKH3_MESCO